MGEFEKRIIELEKHGFEDTVTLVEILSNITFFGTLKMQKCEHAKDGQCEFYFLRSTAKRKIPIATDCRIKDCKQQQNHCHLELSRISCALCPNAAITKTLARTDYLDEII